MSLNCSLPDPWVGDDFAPCFRQTVIDTFIPGLLLLWSLVCVFTALLRHRRASSNLYKPLKPSAAAFPRYGATAEVLPTSTAETEHDDEDDRSSSETAIVVPGYKERATRWSLFNWVRLLAAVPFGLYVYGLQQIASGDYALDEAVEGGLSDSLRVYVTSALYWGYALVLAIVNIAMPSTAKSVVDVVCRQLNVLYTCHLLINAVDLRSFYIVHLADEFTTGYTVSLAVACVTLFVLLVIIHEERNAPAQPVIADSGRVMSGEKWASLYSKFMFSWVDVMMKEGYRRTLNDEDLVELPYDNRAKNVLCYFRKHKSPSLAFSLLKTFRWPLIRQFLYCMVWNIGMFGPPLFLNKIIKYIESGNQGDREPASTAYLYVFGLFITGAVQTLAVQQALYIGRTLGIRIQSIVIGEVFSKSLRRRDDTGAPSDGKGEESKGNVNNLLSVDAQKIAELVAYIFYLYSYPIQIVISIWCLYKLLGVAALWGVLVMILSQPFTFYIGRKFEKLHSAVMSATDKRLKMVNELLAAIRIVKFFAWENDFRKRVSEAREFELKAIRSRLFMFMHMTNAWFMIPVIIMVTVFYVYTLSYQLTASTAFTALALFNTFRGALDEFPLMISFLLQANVSVKRIEKFLAEDEVEITASTVSPDGPYIGFSNDASFSWEKQKKGGDATPVKPTIKNLNLSFPRNKLSIVCGPTGSGKTTLLSSLLGETYRLSGNVHLPRKVPNRNSCLGGAVSGIAYVAQSAWLQNCSIRDNILFGLPYDAERYEKVLYMTALTRDLEILEFGDATEVGEKGVTLSGGQKQRVAIARAVYSQADIVILDDCLSAVDAHTAKHLYEHCLTGELMRDRTVILVTHHVGLCIKGATYVVALREGEVQAAGDPQTLIKSGILGDELASAEEEQANEIGQAATEGPIPVVPKTVKAPQQAGGKLTQEEVRAEGGVSWFVYETYIKASGGYPFWVAVLLLFCCTQATVLGQDYWIKVWAGADISQENNASSAGMFSVSRLGLSWEPSRYAVEYIQPLTTRFSGHRQLDVKYYLGVYFLIGLVAMIMASLRSLILFLGSLRASRKIHEQLLNRILRAKVRFFDVTPIGRIVNRFSSDMETIDQEVAPSLSFLLYSIVATLCVVVLVSAVIPGFLIPGLCIAILYWAIGAYYLRTSRDMKRLNSVSRSPIYVQFSESVNGVVTIRAFGCQSRFIAENHKRIDNNNRPFIWMWATNRWLHCRVETLGAFVGFCTGFVLVMSRNWIDPGLAGLALSYSLTFTHHVLWVVRQYAFNEMNMNAIERIHEYLDIEEEAPARIPETCPPPSWPETGSVKVEELVMKYAPENPPVLRKVSFETRPREKIGIVGRTGSGKSTLALSLFRFMEPASGRILIDGVDISKLGLEDLRSRLTIIPQDPVLFSGTLRHNLDPFGQYTDAELWAAVKRSHLVDNVNDEENPITLDSPVTENGSNWSQGQRQLIALARALVKKSSLIILDEATSSVDFDTDHKIQQTIRKEFVDCSLLCIAHRIRTVADYDRILVLDHGEVKEFDTPYNLIRREGGIFRQMCERSGEYAELLAISKSKHESSCQ